MDPKMEFAVFCTEMYRAKHNLTGSQVMDLFERNRILDYIDDCYGALHVMGTDYILDDIDSLIAEGGYKD